MDNPTTELVPINRQELTKYEEKVKSQIPKYWEKEYIHTHLDKIEDGSDKMLFTTLWYTGLRVSEVIALKKKDIDPQNYTLNALWQKSRKYTYRIVPMHPTIRNMLEIYCSNLKAEERLFPITRQWAWQLCQRYFDGNPHMFRHSFAVNWLRQNPDIVTLHRILGHSRIQTTMEYLKIVPIDQGRELLKITF